MLYLPSIVSVGYYFEKKRALATGLAVCGSGIGAFIFAPLSDFLLSVRITDHSTAMPKCPTTQISNLMLLTV